MCPGRFVCEVLCCVLGLRLPRRGPSSPAAPLQGPCTPCAVQPRLPPWLHLMLTFRPSQFYHLEPANSSLPQVFPYVLPSALACSPIPPDSSLGPQLQGEHPQKNSFCSHTKESAFVTTNEVPSTSPARLRLHTGRLCVRLFSAISVAPGT